MERTYLTVTALNRYLKYKFDNDTQLQSILLKAEISNFKRHSRGHLYLTLKDESSQISAVMFATQTKSLLFTPKDGSKVIIQGYISVYEPYGTYQVYITKMSEDGIGDLYQAYELLKASLEKEGLFSESKKKTIPLYPKAVGVITSPTGAAVRDVIQVIGRRYPLTKIIVYPALVQGVDAKYSIVNQINKANRDHLVDTLIVGRGGGSIEDLWAFNEEIVARAISESSIPIISAVGHETDFTIADFVADLRAATPSQAAEFAVPDQVSLTLRIKQLQQKASLSINNELNGLRKQFDKIKTSIVFSEPSRLFQTSEMKVDHLIDRLNRSSPKNLLIQKEEEIMGYKSRLQLSFRQQLKIRESEFLRHIEKLELVNPLSIMKKGFSIVKKQNKIIESVNNVHINDEIRIQLIDGQLSCLVNKIEKGES
jgi:exodeoxyribonuclease VII large subunit